MVKEKETIDVVEIGLHNLELEVKRCENLAVRTAFDLGMNRGIMNGEQVDRYINLQQRFITQCKCDKVAKQAL